MPGAPAPFGAPAQAAPPAFGAPAAPAPAPQRSFWCAINGQAQLLNEAQARTIDPNTMAMDEAQTIGWTPIGQLLGAAAPAPAQPAFQQPAFQQPTQPAFQQPAQPAFQQPAQPAFQRQPVPAMQQQPFGQQPQQGGYPAAAAPANLFSGVANASVTRRGNNLTGGQYVGRFVSAEYKEGQNGIYVIAEVDIIISNYIEGDPINGKSTPAGQRVSIFVKKNQNFDSNIKEIMLALSPHNPDNTIREDTDNIPPHETAALLTQPCPFAGQYVYLMANETMTKGGPQAPPHPFTRINWWHCPKDAAGNPDIASMNANYR
jgi:hypothetical protein